MEILDLYNNKKILINKTFIREEGNPVNNEYKLSVHLWIMNDKGEFLIQRRSLNKSTNPLKWGYTSGAVTSGESSLEGMLREAKEELGLDFNEEDLELLITFKRKHDFVDVWLIKANIDIKIVVKQEEEVCDVKWVDITELNELIQNNEFVPTINLYYDLFLKLLVKCHNFKMY